MMNKEHYFYVINTNLSSYFIFLFLYLKCNPSTLFIVMGRKKPINVEKIINCERVDIGSSIVL